MKNKDMWIRCSYCGAEVSSVDACQLPEVDIYLQQRKLAKFYGTSLKYPMDYSSLTNPHGTYTASSLLCNKCLEIHRNIRHLAEEDT